MSIFDPVAEADASEKVAQAYGRIKETLGVDAVPPPYLVMGQAPSLLQDFYMNAKRFVLGEGKLAARTKALVAVGVASGQASRGWLDYLLDHGRKIGITDTELNDAVAVASTCAVYNVFFKFRELSGSDIFSGMSVGLRAHTFAGTSLDAKSVEIICIAISNINGCKLCTAGHVAKARELGASDEEILEVIQCSATVFGAAHYLGAAGLEATQDEAT